MSEQFNKESDDALRTVLQTKEGRRYLYELLDFCGMHRGSFTGNSETFYREGMRNVALKIFADIGRVDGDAYLKMIQETKFNNELVSNQPKTKKEKS